jgi:transglutaminase-like putative cysteine protease
MKRLSLPTPLAKSLASSLSLLTFTTFAIAAYIFFVGSRNLYLIPFTVLIALASYTTSFRFRVNTSGIVWSHVAFLIIAFFLAQNSDVMDYPNGQNRMYYVIGQMCCLAAAGWFWMQRPRYESHSNLYALAASGGVAIMGCNSNEEGPLRYLIPLYALFFTLTLRGYRSRPSVSWRSPALYLRAGAVGLLFILFTAQMSLFTKNKDYLTAIAGNLLTGRLQLDAGAMANQPVLGNSFGLDGGVERVLRTEGYEGGHLRGMAYWEYGNRRWSPPFTQMHMMGASREELQVAAPDVKGRTTVGVTKLGRNNPLFYLPLETISLEVEPDTKVQREVVLGTPLILLNEGTDTYQFIIPSDHQTSDFQGMVAFPKINPTNGRDYLKTKGAFSLKTDVKIRALALSIAQEAHATTDKEKIRAVISYLQSHHHYSLSFQSTDQEPLADFLLSQPAKNAHCEYFASSATMLLRYLNVPTRYVTGYFAHEPEGTSGTALIIRGRDAHAWSEAWVEGTGWVTVEATPGDGLPQDEGLNQFQQVWERVEDFFRNLRQWFLSRDPSEMRLGVLVLLAPLLFFALRPLLLRRRVAITTANTSTYSESLPDLAALGRAFEQYLTKNNIPSPAHKLWSASLEQSDHPSADSALAFALAYEDARYSGDAPPEKLSQLNTLLKALPTTSPPKNSP